MLSQYVEPGTTMELLADNADGVGYLLKDRISDVDEFAAAVRRVGEGGSALDAAVVSELLGRRRSHDPLAELTPPEREVLELMAEGKSNQADRRGGLLGTRDEIVGPVDNILPLDLRIPGYPPTPNKSRPHSSDLSTRARTSLRELPRCPARNEPPLSLAADVTDASAHRRGSARSGAVGDGWLVSVGRK